MTDVRQDAEEREAEAERPAGVIDCEWCGAETRPPFRHFLDCPELDPAEVARRIAGGECFVDAEAIRVARALLERQS